MKVARLAKVNGVSLISLSLAIGRSPTSVGRWVWDGVPYQLPDEDARRLATLLGIPGERFGATD